MGKQFSSIAPEHREFIERQHIFFNASAASEGRVNLSPRDVASLRVLDPNTVIYLDLTGSGNETAAHLLADGRLTLMFCAFEGAPLILRLYGQGRVIPRHTDEYNALLASHYNNSEPPGARQIFHLTVDSVQTSCGMNVPFYEYVGQRDQLIRWAQVKGESALDEYRLQKNTRSIDGLPTGIEQSVPVSKEKAQALPMATLSDNSAHLRGHGHRDEGQGVIRSVVEGSAVCFSQAPSRPNRSTESQVPHRP
jgi:hypothetical protein